MAIQRHCPPSSASACFPAPALAAIIIASLILTLLISLYVYHALKARQAAPTDEEAQQEPNTIDVLPTASLPHRPSPTLTTPFAPHPQAPNMPRPRSPRPSSHTLSVPLFYNPNPQIPAQASSTLIGTATPSPHPPRPPLHRNPRQLTHYLSALEERFTPESGARTEAEVEGIFQGVENRKLPRPGREKREVEVVRAWVLEGEGGRRGGWYEGGRA